MSTPRPTRSILRALLLVLGAVLALALAAPGMAAAKPGGYHNRVSGATVSGSTSVVDGSGCIVDYTSLYASSGGTSGAYAYYNHEVYDQCNSVEISYVYGSAAPTTFTVAANLSSAHLVADFLLSDGTTAAVDETFTATSPASTQRVSQSYRTPDTFYRYSFVGQSRSAVGTGTLPLTGDIGMSKTGEFSIVHL
jgi:hypothetical protein